MNSFDTRFAAVGVGSLIDHFGEMDGDEFVPAQILLRSDCQPFSWPRVIVGKLTERYVEENNRVASREAVVITGPTAELETGSTPLTDETQVLIPKYGEKPFNVNPDECEYGGVMTKLSLMRVPVRSLGNFHEASTQ